MTGKKQSLMLAILFITMIALILSNVEREVAAAPTPPTPAAPPQIPQATATPCTSRSFIIGPSDSAQPPVAHMGNRPTHLASSGKSVVGQPAKWQPNAPISFILDDGSYNYAIGIVDDPNNPTISYSAIWLNRFTLDAGNYPLYIAQISILWPTPIDARIDLSGKNVTLLVYLDTDGDNNPANATNLLQSQRSISIVNGTDFENYSVNVAVSGPGDVYIGFTDTFNNGGVSPASYPGSLDSTNPQHRSWSSFQNDTRVPNLDNLGGNDNLSTIEDISNNFYTGNWLVRASGETTTCLTPLPTNTPTATYTIGPTNTQTPTPTITPTPTVTPTATDCANIFTDISNNIFYTAIHYLACGGFVSGTDATHYTPGGTATRAQFAKTVVLSFGIPSYTPIGGGSNFTDVSPTYYAFPYIEAGYNANILSGYGYNACVDNGLQYPCFMPERLITRAQLTSLVTKADHTPFFFPSAPTYSDLMPSSVFYVAVESAHHAGIINGYPDGKFRPNNPIRRDEMAQIVYKASTTP